MKLNSTFKIKQIQKYSIKVYKLYNFKLDALKFEPFLVFKLILKIKIKQLRNQFKHLELSNSNTQNYQIFNCRDFKKWNCFVLNVNQNRENVFKFNNNN